MASNSEKDSQSGQDTRSDRGGEASPSHSDEDKKKRMEELQKRLQKLKEKEKKKGVIYISRIPPNMKPRKLRSLLEPHGEIGRVYLAPKEENPRAKKDKKSKRNTGVQFSEGWVEFMDKKVAKRVVEMLNGQQMGGRRRSAHYYDLWSMKVIESCRGSLCSVSFHQKCSQCPRGLLDHYDSSEACFGGRYGQDGSVYARCIVQYLPKFKWDYLTEEAVYKQKVREQKLAVELSAAKRERDFYMQKVGESKAVKAMEERRAKKRQREGGAGGEPMGKEGEENAQKKIRTHGQRPIKDAQGPRAKVSSKLLSMLGGAE